MTQSETTLSEIYEGLQALSAAAFPKQCQDCGKQYGSLEELIAQTSADTGSGLKASTSLLNPGVEIERSCSCGALLSESFNDRRAGGQIGAQRRTLFDRLLSLLIEGGLPQKMAKKELLKVMKGQPSDLLDKEQLARFFAG